MIKLPDVHRCDLFVLLEIHTLTLHAHWDPTVHENRTLFFVRVSFRGIPNPRPLDARNLASSASSASSAKMAFRLVFFFPFSRLDFTLGAAVSALFFFF